MAFGQPAGPPASGRQIEELAALLERAGFVSFREARHPYGLTQRQANGKFTVDEATELIDRLTAAEIVQQSADDAGPSTGTDASTAVVADPSPAAGTGTRRAPARAAAPRRRPSRSDGEVLASLSDETIVAELERRGWCCIPPLAEPI